MVFEYQNETGVDVINKKFVSESNYAGLIVRYLGNNLSITNLLYSMIGKQVAVRTATWKASGA